MATSRSAHATIKGYFYQFDHTIVRLLEASAPQSSVVVEGIEDIDLEDGADSAFVQCKYYEGTEYNHSVIKDAVILMLRHFHARGCPTDQQFKYQLFGHYKSGQHKLATDFDLDFLKKNFLTYEEEKVSHSVHSELGLDDEQLTRFRTLLEVDLLAPSYDSQQVKIIRLLVSKISGCTAQDARVFYYPNAINVIQKLAIRAEASERRITKARFISTVNQKEIVFSLWLQQKFGDEYYARLIKRKYFKFSSTKIPKASRVFIVDMGDAFDLTEAIALLSGITRFSHVEHRHTPAQDRFCPYVLLRGITAQDMVLLKERLLAQGMKFADGYPFHGSEFSPGYLAAAPTKENLVRLKFIPSMEQLVAAVSAITDSIVEIFDFFVVEPLPEAYAPRNVPHHKIKVECPYFTTEVL